MVATFGRVKALNNHIIDIIGVGKTTGNGHSHTYGKVISNVGSGIYVRR